MSRGNRCPKCYSELILTYISGIRKGKRERKECVRCGWHQQWEYPNQKCPNCGDDKHYRIVYKGDEEETVDFFDCMMCHTHWDIDGIMLGVY